MRTSRTLSAGAGMNRFIWYRNYAPPAVLQFTYPIAAVYRNTPRTPLGPWISPGRYTVTLSANGQRFSRALTVRMDPRVKTDRSALKLQLSLSLQVAADLRANYDALREIRGLRRQVGDLGRAHV